MAHPYQGALHYQYMFSDSIECVATTAKQTPTPPRIKAERAKNWIINMANERKGKDYIMSLFMESLYLHKKYWRQLKPIDLSKFYFQLCCRYLHFYVLFYD